MSGGAPRPVLLEVRDARFAYRRGVAVLDGVDLEVRRGDVVALLGHNGCGKSTLLQAVLDLVRLRSGSISIAGSSSMIDGAKVHVLLAAGNEHLPTFLSGRELVHLLARLYAVAVDDARVDELFERYGMSGRQDDLLEDYSHGMRKKTQIVAALLLGRPLTIVDETLNGIDRESLLVAEDDLRTLSRDGALVLCSHDLDMLERVASRAVVLDGGRIVADLPIAEVRASHGSIAALLDERARRG